MSRMLTRILICAVASMVIASAWADTPKTPQEAKVIAQLKAAYQQRGLTFTPQDEDQALARHSPRVVAIRGARAATTQPSGLTFIAAAPGAAHMPQGIPSRR